MRRGSRGHGRTPRRTNHTVHALRALSVRETLPADLWLFVCVTPCRDKLHAESFEINRTRVRFSILRTIQFYIYLINPLLQSDLDTRYRLEALSSDAMVVSRWLGDAECED